MRCPTCKKWEITSTDIYCSWCRTILIDFTVSLNSSYTYVGEILDDDIALTIKHTGTIGNLQIDSITSDQNWLKVDTRQAPNPKLHQGEQIQFPLVIDPMSLPEAFHTAHIDVVTSIGTRRVLFEVVPKPEIQVFTGEYTVLLDGLPEEKKLSGYLEVKRGIVSLKALETNVPWAKVKLANDEAYPVLLDGRSTGHLEFEFIVDEEMLIEMSRESLPAEYEGNLVIRYVELEPERTAAFHVNCLLPPSLQIPEESGTRINRDVYVGRRHELHLTLQNGDAGKKGRADLQILDIQINVDWLRPTAQISYPLIIGSGLFNQTSFTISSKEVTEGRHVAKLTFLTNTPGPMRQKDVYVEVNIQQMTDFDGTIAIDFGTVNSCCATFDNLGMQKLIELESRESKNQKPTTVPSVILYNDRLNGSHRLYEIGSKAYAYSFQTLAASSTVRQVKRNLGKSTRFNISYYNDPTKQDQLSPKEIAADILKRILERAEDEVKGHVVNCTVSHPSRFSLRQIDDLKAALYSCGVKSIKTMHEPLGAALNYIQQNRQPKDSEQYHLMVFDFGGGTTDITLLHVSSRWDDERKIFVITPKVLGASGDRWFGGEDVTDMVMHLTFEKCQEVIYKRYSEQDIGKEKIIIPFNAEDFVNDAGRQNNARTNRTYLREWAEEAKIAISEHARSVTDLDETENPPEFRSPDLRVIVDNEDKSETFNAPDKVVPSVAELNAQLRPRLEELTEMMRLLAVNNGISSPDVILLSGKSSAFPIVREVIQSQFRRAEIHSPNDLKECVVLGACQFSHNEAVAGIYIEADESTCLSATTSRLGVRVNDAGQIKFKEIVGAGVPIDANGLKVPVTGTILKRTTQIRILENTGLVDEMVIHGKENRNITLLKEFRLEQKLAEWERNNNQLVTDKMLFDAKLELDITPNLGVKLIAKVPGIAEPFEFEADFSGW